jgi:hypothetical protein
MPNNNNAVIQLGSLVKKTLSLRRFLDEKMRQWESFFPDELWVEFDRLTKGTGSAKKWNKLVRELILDYLDKDVLEWLKVNDPQPIGDQTYNKWLNGKYGLKKLHEQIWQTIGISKTCDNLEQLQKVMAERLGGKL